MHEADVAFTGSIPELYDTHLGPFLFAPYAREMAARVVRLNPSSLLEVAAGTGVATRELARGLPATPIVATDLNVAMLDRARGVVTAPNVTFAQADAMSLPYDDARFQAIVCQFGVMFFPDRVAAFREARRVLARGGTYLFSVWSGVGDNDAGRIVQDVVTAAFPTDPPTFLRRTPYGHGDPVAIERDLRAAGFGRIVCDEVAERSVAQTATGVARGLIEGSPLRAEIVARDPARIAEIVRATEVALAASLGEPLDGAMRALVFRASVY